MAERWDVYDQDGHVTGKSKTQEDRWIDGEYHLGASLWIVNNNGNLLVQKRASTKKMMPNVWCITGGSVHSGETSRQGCVREVCEEVGIRVNEDDITFLGRTFSKDSIYDDYAIIYDFSLENVIIQPEEVSEVRWASIEEIKQFFYQEEFMINNLKDLEKISHFIAEHIR